MAGEKAAAKAAAKEKLKPTWLPDAEGRQRPTWAPQCCEWGLWILHPTTGIWVCSECRYYRPMRGKRHGK